MLPLAGRRDYRHDLPSRSYRHRLKDAAIRRLKPKDKPYKVTDRDGLYLLVQPSGAKWWRFDYRFLKKRKTISVGVYPDTKLAQARGKLGTLRKQLAGGHDPSVVRRTEVRRREFEARNFFRARRRC